MNTRGWCARGVNRAMRAAGLYVTPLPSAYMYAKKLSADSRFREIQGLTKAQLVKLPPGAIANVPPETDSPRSGSRVALAIKSMCTLPRTTTAGAGLSAIDRPVQETVHERRRGDGVLLLLDAPQLVGGEPIDANHSGPRLMM